MLYCQCMKHHYEEGNFEGKIFKPHSLSWEQIKEDAGLTKRAQSQTRRRKTAALEDTRGKGAYPMSMIKCDLMERAPMIAGLAESGKGIPGEPKYLQPSEDAITFVKQIVDGRVMVRYRDSEVKNKGLSTITLFSYGPISISMKLRLMLSYLQKAENWQTLWSAYFWDEEHGGSTSPDTMLSLNRPGKRGKRAFRETVWQPFSTSCVLNKSRWLITNWKSRNDVFRVQARHRARIERPCFLYAKCVRHPDA